MAYNYETLRKISRTKKAKEYIAQIEKYYQEHYANKSIETLSFFDFKRYKLDGDRITYENAYFERRNRLFLLQVLAIAKDKYLSALEDILAAICDEYTWVLPAHTRFTIDLFAAETGSYLAETAYVFGDKLSEEIRTRIYNSVERKIVQAYEAQPRFNWENYKNNWVAVCSGGVGLSYLYLFPERLANVKERLFGAFEEFIRDGFDEDGYCTEGVGYLLYGMDWFCAFFRAYELVCNERPAIVDGDKIKSILSFFDRSRMQQRIYLPFSDTAQVQRFNVHSLVRIKSLYPDEFIIPEADLSLHANKALGLSYLYNLLTPQKGKQEKKEECVVYYKNPQVFIGKRKNYAFASKGGNNNELHNHNDIGAFQIVRKGKRYICDVGTCVYTREVFDTGRYNVFNCGSQSHSVPIIDGKYQSAGAEHYGKVVKVDDNSIAYDITNAYDDATKNVTVTYLLLEKGVDVRYTCTGIKKNVIFRFVSDIKPVLKDGVVHIADMKILCDKTVLPTIEKVKYSTYGKTHLATSAVAYTIDYSLDFTGDIDIRFAIEL